MICKSKDQGKDQESIQSITTPDPGHHKKWQNTRKYHTQDSQEAIPFLAGDHNSAMNSHDNMTDTKRIHKRSSALERSVKSILLDSSD